jgi:adenylosuccinate synthase
MGVDVVIGAAYGDEGKGATVNSLANEQSLVVRFNGGCQAGHTVEHDGIRHVFSHFGAGTLRGAETYLSSFFVTSPLAFYNEHKALISYGLYPRVYVSKDCLVTTPWDMMLNRALEDSRGDKRHGSVGVGFNETIERCQHEQFRLTVGDLDDGKLLQEKLEDIAEVWVSLRARELDISIEHNKYDIDDMWDLCHMMLADVSVVNNEQEFMANRIAKNRQHTIFEGAQGLMLDQTYGTFPYVTRSNCGLKNVLQLVPNSTQLNLIYVTRAYTTRHGAGPFPNELPDKPYSDIVDQTNLPHYYQGSLRFSYLNLDTLKYAIHRDLDDANDTVGLIYAHGHMTCLDQLPPHNNCGVILDGESHGVLEDELYRMYLNYIGLQSMGGLCNV